MDITTEKIVKGYYTNRHLQENIEYITVTKEQDIKQKALEYSLIIEYLKNIPKIYLNNVNYGDILNKSIRQYCISDYLVETSDVIIQIVNDYDIFVEYVRNVKRIYNKNVYV